MNFLKEKAKIKVDLKRVTREVKRIDERWLGERIACLAIIMRADSHRVNEIKGEERESTRNRGVTREGDNKGVKSRGIERREIMMNRDREETGGAAKLKVMRDRVVTRIFIIC